MKKNVKVAVARDGGSQQCGDRRLFEQYSAPHQVEGSWTPRSETVPSTTYSPGLATAPWSRESSPSESDKMMFPDFRFRAHGQ